MKRIVPIGMAAWILSGCPSPPPTIQEEPIIQIKQVGPPQYPADYQLDVIESKEAEEALKASTPEDTP